MKYNPFSRRMFLRGTGGYLLAVPFLPSLAPLAHAQTAANSQNLRFAMFLGQLGRDMSQWYPNIPDTAMTQVNGALVKPLAEIPKPLSYILNNGFNPVMNKIALLRGLDCVSTNGMHNSFVPTTGSSFHPASEQGFGYSIDAVLEESKKFYPIAPRTGALRTCPHPTFPYSDFQSFSYTSKIKSGQQLLPEFNPVAVYNKLLNAANTQVLALRNGRLKSATDIVLDNFKQVMNGRQIASADKQRLDAYMTNISEIHKQMGTPLQACGQAGQPVDQKVLSEIHKSMIRMEVAALACGTTKIVMHSIIHASDEVTPHWHDYAHGGEAPSSVDSKTGRSYLSEYNKFSMDLVAFFLTELDKIQEPNGNTLLDNTLFLYGNEDGTGSHEHADLPVLVAGAKGKLRTGYFIDYRQRPFLNMTQHRQFAVLNAGRPYNGLLVSALKSMGLNENDYQKFGKLGFGGSGSAFGNNNKHYTQFLGSRVNDTLPFLFAG